jgi:hypothetical protein
VSELFMRSQHLYLVRMEISVLRQIITMVSQDCNSFRRFEIFTVPRSAQTQKKRFVQHLELCKFDISN